MTPKEASEIITEVKVGAQIREKQSILPGMRSEQESFQSPGSSRRKEKQALSPPSLLRATK